MSLSPVAFNPTGEVPQKRVAGMLAAAASRRAKRSMMSGSPAQLTVVRSNFSL